MSLASLDDDELDEQLGQAVAQLNTQKGHLQGLRKLVTKQRSKIETLRARVKQLRKERNRRGNT